MNKSTTWESTVKPILVLSVSALVVSLLICVVEFVDTENAFIARTNKQESVLYYPMAKFAGVFFPAARDAVGEWI